MKLSKSMGAFGMEDEGVPYFRFVAEDLEEERILKSLVGGRRPGRKLYVVDVLEFSDSTKKITLSTRID